MPLSPAVRRGGGATTLFVSTSERGLDAVEERAVSIDRLLGVESRGGFLGTGGGGLWFRLEELDDAVDAGFGGLGSCERLGFREAAGIGMVEEGWALVEAFIVEVLRGRSVEVALGSWYEDGLETVTQSGSGLGVKGFGGLRGFKTERAFGGSIVDRAGRPIPMNIRRPFRKIQSLRAYHCQATISDDLNSLEVDQEQSGRTQGGPPHQDHHFSSSPSYP